MKKIYIDNFVQFNHLVEDKAIDKKISSPEYYPCILIIYQTLWTYCYRREFIEHEFRVADDDFIDI